MLERDVIRKTLAAVKPLGIPHIRMAMMNGVTSGWPDYLFLLPGGRTLWIEFKKPGAKPTALQAHRLATLDALGFECAVIDDHEKGAAQIRRAYEAAKKRERAR